MKFDLRGALTACNIAEKALSENRDALQEAGNTVRELTEDLTLDHSDDEWWHESETRQEKERVEAQIAELELRRAELENQLRLARDEVVLAELELEKLWDEVPEASKAAIRAPEDIGFAAPWVDTGWRETPSIPGLQYYPPQNSFVCVLGMDPKTDRTITHRWCRVEKTVGPEHTAWFVALKERLHAAS